jgi:broad specificity phosphatase PhoE
VQSTSLLLIRHATCDPVGHALAGRAPGIGLNDDGRAQAAALASALRTEPLSAVYTSPLQRARDTAVAIAAVHGLPVIEAEGLQEIDFGEWTGSTLAALDGDATWADFNVLRSVTRAPGGELLLEAQARAVATLLPIVRHHAGSTIAAVTHADVIRAVLCHLLGMPMDNLLRVDISPAAVATVVFDGRWPRLAGLSRPA